MKERNEVIEASREAEATVHAAAQVAVTTSFRDPRIDFEINALGTFNVLEAARRSKRSPTIIHCSTNKVYGSNINKTKEQDTPTKTNITNQEYPKTSPSTYASTHHTGAPSWQENSTPKTTPTPTD